MRLVWAAAGIVVVVLVVGWLIGWLVGNQYERLIGEWLQA